jgi:hypothetical protein
MELASYAILAMVVVAALAGLVRPGIGAALGFLVFAIEQGLASGIPYFVARPTLWNLLSAFIVIMLLLSAVLRGRYRLRGFFRPVFVSSLLLVAYFIWACQWGPLPDVWALANSVVPYAAIQMVLVPLLVQSEADARAMFNWLAICGTGIGLLALLHLDASQNTQRFAAQRGGRGHESHGVVGGMRPGRHGVGIVTQARPIEVVDDRAMAVDDWLLGRGRFGFTRGGLCSIGRGDAGDAFGARRWFRAT